MNLTLKTRRAYTACAAPHGQYEFDSSKLQADEAASNAAIFTFVNTRTQFGLRCGKPSGLPVPVPGLSTYIAALLHLTVDEGGLTKPYRSLAMSSNPSVVSDFQPLFTREQVFAQEDAHNETWGVNRRMTLMMLTRTPDELRTGCADAEVVSAITQVISDYKSYLLTSIEQADAALARLLIVDSASKELCHV